MQLTSLSLALTRAGFLSFSPASLFAAGEPGVWYDPSDFSTMFQDAAGATPVTAVEQPVGLILDKSKGLVLGPELVTNGDFSSGTNWTTASGAAGGGTAISGGVLAVTRSGGYIAAGQSIPFVAGKSYRISCLAKRTSGSGAVALVIRTLNDISSTARLTAITASTTDFAVYSAVYVCNTTENAFMQLGVGTSDGVIEFDNISVRELPGNHATQTTSTSRPVLSARVNLLTATEDFSNAWWVKTAITLESSTVTAPDGTATATRFSNTAATSTHRLASTVVTLGRNSMVLWAKAGTASFISINRAATDFQAVFDLSTGTVSSSAGCTATITPDNNGFYKLTLLSPTVSSQYLCVNFATTAANAAANVSFLGAGETMIIWHPDVRVANTGVDLPAYQRVNTATDYDTTGFPLYLKFDGVDDFLVTNSINFTATDKMTVFAGVRKLSDAAAAVVAELSANINSNNGAFVVTAPFGTVPLYAYGARSKGTSVSDVFSPTSTPTAPATNVLTGIGDISGDRATLRVNGAEAASSTSDQGTGNYGNYPLYIGRRGGTTLPFNGHLYSLIVRGAQSSAGQIASAETWVNSKTGAY